MLIVFLVFQGLQLTFGSNFTSRYQVQLISDPSIGLVRLSTHRDARSIVACIASCLHEHGLTCKSALFNHVTSACTPGSWVSNTLPVPTPEEGNLYIQASSCYCDANKGFVLRHYGSSYACVGRFISYLNYSAAENFCQSKGAVLMSVQPTDRLEILKSVGGSYDFWVGLDDREVEGRYVWLGDGSVMTEEQKVFLFPPNEPNGGVLKEEDCIDYRGSKNMLLNDEDCGLKLPVICEII